MAKLTEKSLATAVTLNSLIHIVNTGDTTQSAYGSSYKAELSQLVPLFGSNPDITVTGGTYNPTTGEVTFYNNTGGTFNVSGFVTGFTDSFVSGGTYTAGTATFTNTTGGTFTVTGFTSGDTNFANTNLTFTGNRAHNTNGNSFELSTDGGLYSQSVLYMDSNQLDIGYVNNYLGTTSADTTLYYSGLNRVGVKVSETVINEDGGNYDFRVEGDSDTNLLFIDASTDRVGVGTNLPSEKLDVSGKTKTINFQMTSGATNGYVLTSDAGGNGTWQASSGGVSIDPFNNIGSTGTSFTWDVSGLSTNYQVTLTANTTLNLSNVRNGDYGTLIVSQDAVGSRTITFGTVNGSGTTHRVANGGAGSPTLTSNINAIDILTFTYNGSTMFWTVGNDYT